MMKIVPEFMFTEMDKTTSQPDQQFDTKWGMNKKSV